MTHTALAIALVAVPALLAGQSPSNAQPDISIPGSYSAYARERITSAFKSARARHVPDDQLRKRLAEGQARGATDIQVSSAVQRTETWLEASRALLIRIGREQPEPEEITNAEQAMERGATEAQIEAIVRNPPANATIAAALSTLAVSAPSDSVLARVVGERKP